MKHLKVVPAVFCFFMFASVFFSCKDNPSDPGGTDPRFIRFPVADGSEWNYKFEQFAFNPRPAGISYNTDTLTGTGTSTILGDTVLNGLQVKVMETAFHQPEFGTATSFTYYMDTDTALLRIALRSYSVPFGPDSHAGSDYTYRFNNREYSSINELLYHAGNNFSPDAGGDIVYDNPPAVLFKYPVTTNEQWLYKFYAEDFSIHRKYMGYELVKIPAGSFTCMRVDKILPPDYGDIKLSDYYSNSGPVKSDNLYKNVMIINKAGQKIGLVDVREIKTLQSN